MGLLLAMPNDVIYNSVLFSEFSGGVTLAASDGSCQTGVV